MKEEWKKVKLGEIATFSNGINFGKESYTPGVKLIGVSNFGNRLFPDYEELEEVDEKVLRPNDYLKNGDIVFVRSNGNKELVGRCMLIQNPPSSVTYSGFCIRSRLNNVNENSPRFFAYYFKSKIFRKAMSNTAVGANIQNLNQGLLSNHELTLPPLPTQQKIASILSAYDDLIENNRKQIKLLEEAAQKLYKEWFVKLNFPGHETTKIVDGIPEGWNEVTIGDLFGKLESGSRPKGGIDASLTDGIASVGAENVIGLGQYSYASEKIVSVEYFEKAKRGIIENRDILIYKDGAYIGRTSLFQDDFPHAKAMINEHVFLLHTKDDLKQYFTFFTLYQQTYFQKMQKLNKNAAQPGINQDAIKSLKILLPTDELIRQYDDFVTPVMKKIFSLAKQNSQLQSARDKLLPKLMNGEFDL